MKNLHIIEDEENKREYFIGKKDNKLFYLNDRMKTGGVLKACHVYITSEEKPKAGDWCFNPKRNKVIRVGHHGHYGYSSKKIIMSDNPLLINEGVQEISYNFLKLIVENPNYEEVKVESEIKYFDKNDLCVSIKCFDTDYEKTIYYPYYNNKKNIHLLSTDKETILHFDHTGLFLSRDYQLSNTINSIVQGRNIYITSDTSDIHDNDYIITKDGRLVQVSYLLSSDLDGASKVILTTDTDLIQDGIQKINSEFLIWFVNNPSCEYVQVEINYKKYKKGNITLSNCYELIIPNIIKCYDKFNQPLSEGDYVDVQKDGPHQIYKKEDGQLYFKPYGQEDKVSSYFSNDMVKCDSEGNWITNDRYEETEDVIGKTYFDILKQEAIEKEMDEYDFEENLENAAKKYWETNKFKSDYPHCPLSFKDGAKWYQEQDKLSEWNIRQEEQFNCNLKLIGEFGAGYDAGYAEAEKELFSKEDLQTAFQLGRTYEITNHESTNQLEIVEYLNSIKKK